MIESTPTVAAEPQMHVRWMIRRDMPEVLAIEAASGSPCPWGEEQFLSLLRQRNCIGMVVERHPAIDPSPVLGWMLYELQDGRLELLNLAVHPAHRRRGVGGRLMMKLIGKLSQHRRPLLTAKVRETNLAGQFFLRSCGLLARTVHRGWWRDTGEDAYGFVFDLEG